MLNARISYEEKGAVSGVPEFQPVVHAIDEIPADVPADALIVVSALYVNAAQLVGANFIDRLRTVSQPVYENSENPRPVGCLGLNRVF